MHIVAQKQGRKRQCIGNFWHANFIKIIRKPMAVKSHVFLFTTINWRETVRNRMKQALLVNAVNRDDNTRNLHSIMAICTADC